MRCMNCNSEDVYVLDVDTEIQFVSNNLLEYRETIVCKNCGNRFFHVTTFSTHEVMSEDRKMVPPKQ